MTCAIKGFWVIGESCGHVSDCLDPNALCTRDGVCQCKTGYRTKTEKEFWDNPYDRTDCVKVDFSLGEFSSSLCKNLNVWDSPFDIRDSGWDGDGDMRQQKTYSVSL